MNFQKLWALSGLVLIMLAGLALAPFSIATAEDVPPDPLKPTNLSEIDFAVPWGFRYGLNTRIYFRFDVDAEGKPFNIEILRSTPHRYYNNIAKTALEKFRYPPGPVREGLVKELQYCVLSDHQSTFACRIIFQRLDVDDALVAKAPEDPGFYRVDKFSGSPKVLKYLFPEYPRQASVTNTCGWVVADFKLKRGKPKDIRILKSSHANLFSLSTRDALKKFEFESTESKERIKYLISFVVPGVCLAGGSVD